MTVWAGGPSYREAKGGAPRLDRGAGWWNRFPAFRVWLRSSAIRSRLLPLLGARVKSSGQECPLYTNLGCFLTSSNWVISTVAGGELAGNF